MPTMEGERDRSSEEIAEIKEAIKKCSHTFSYGITVVNTISHDITFLDSYETKIPVLREGASKLNDWVLQNRLLGERITIPYDKACVLNAKTVKRKFTKYLIITESMPTDDGNILLDLIFDTFDSPYIIGTIMTMGAYPGRVKPCFLEGLEIGMDHIPGLLIYKKGE